MKGWPAAVLGLALACREPAPAPPAVNRSLPPGVVARVGDQGIAAESVRRIGAVQKLGLREARERAVFDARVALEGQRVLEAPLRRQIERGAGARALLEQLALQAESEGPPRDAEVARLSEERWLEVDRPPSARVAHAVALRPAGGPAEAARRVAESLREAVQGVTDPEEFLEHARSVPTEGVEVRAERLPPVTPDGRTFSPEGAAGPTPNFDEVFASAANALVRPGEQSAVVETKFGFHVLLLEERLPERRIPFEERRAAFAPEILARRADARRAALLARLRQTTPVSVAREADALTSGLVARP